MAARRTAGESAAAAAPPGGRNWLPWIVAGAVLVLGGLLTLRFWFYADRRVHHVLDVDLPESAPRGDVVRVVFGVKPGDVFVTDVSAKNRIVTALVEGLDTKQGMALDVQLTLGHAVSARPGGGTSSEVRVILVRADSHVGSLVDNVWVTLGSKAAPYLVAYDRDAAGRPLRASAHSDAAAPLKRFALDGVLSGLGDLATDWLPPRDVRLGEAWDVADVADVLPGVERIVRVIAQRENLGDGFPPAKVRARVQAVAAETHEGEDCLRLRVTASLTIEGDAVAPARPGWMSVAARLDGPVWISRSTGIVWGMDVKSDVIASYLSEVLPTERKATGRVVATTHRADRLPD